MTITDQQLWLLKFLWFRDWRDQSAFEPWYYVRTRPPFETGTPGALAVSAGLPLSVVHRELAIFEQRGWLAPTERLRLQSRACILDALIAHHQQTAPAWQALRSRRLDGPALWSAVYRACKLGVIPISGRYVLTERLDIWTVIGHPRAERFRDLLSAYQSRSPDLDPPWILYQTTEAAKERCFGGCTRSTPELLEPLALAPAALEDAQIILLQPGESDDFLLRATSHVGDVPSVDLLQAFLDVCRFPWTEEPGHLERVRQLLLC